MHILTNKNKIVIEMTYKMGHYFSWWRYIFTTI